MTLNGNPVNNHDILREAHVALLRGDKARSRQLLSTLIRSDPRNEKAWLLLAEAVDDKDQAIYCLERVLFLNRRNALARRWLACLKSNRETRFAPISSQISVAEPKASQPIPSIELRKGFEGVVQQEEKKILGTAQKGALPHETNWSLILGSMIVAIMVFLAIVGPWLAPHDPLKENLVIKVGEKWYVPPFDPLTPGFPLGSDEYGRDLFSRLLWAIRPTLVLVLVVATIRLMVGLVIGMLAGWSSGRLGHLLETMIEISLSMPVLLVALGAIAIIGVEFGIWAFIIGLSLTGWVETAQQVHAQTRVVSKQAYIEAARALGASRNAILFKHVLRQIIPMLLMLYAFEISSTLMATAGLGFLGYYIGGDVWLDVSDFVARRVSGAPELGQMLATSWSTLTRPWAMVAVGNVVFVMVLGFNLVGEGLRKRLQGEVVGRRDFVVRIGEQVGLWFEQNVGYPLSSLSQRLTIRKWQAALILVLITCLIFSYSLGLHLPMRDLIRQGWQKFYSSLVHVENLSTTPKFENNADSSNKPGLVWTFPIGHKVGSDSLPRVLEDGTVVVLTSDNWLFIINADGNLRYKQRLQPAPYIFTKPSAVQGGKIFPILLPGETIMVVSMEQTVYAINREGKKLWEQPLMNKPIDDQPLQTDAGEIFVADWEAGLYAFDAQGLRFYFHSDVAPHTVSNPIIGRDGVIYFMTTNRGSAFVHAISPEGKLLWVSEARTAEFYERLQMSPDDRYLFLHDDVIDAQSGELLTYVTSVKIDRFLIGHDKRVYAVSGDRVFECLFKDGLIVVQSDSWEEQSSIKQSPLEIAVDENHVIWFSYGTYHGVDQIVWLSLDGEVIGKYRLPKQVGYLSEMDFQHTRYTDCTLEKEKSVLICETHAPGSTQPVWRTLIEGIPQFSRGVIKNGFGYFMTFQGDLSKVYLGQP